MDRIRLNGRIPRALLERPIAHRGLHGDLHTPENSLKAFDAAIRAGAPIEMDVQMLADGTLIIFHDSDLERMTGTPGKLADQDRRSIGPLRLQNTDEPIPLFADVMDLVRGKVAMLVEIKSVRSRDGMLARATLNALRGYSGPFAIQSFNPSIVHWFRKHAPHICRGQLSGGQAGIPFGRLTQPDFVAYHLGSMPSAAVTRARHAGVATLVWTVRTAAQQQKALNVADNYIFDCGANYDPYGSPNAA